VFPPYSQNCQFTCTQQKRTTHQRGSQVSPELCVASTELICRRQLHFRKICTSLSHVRTHTLSRIPPPSPFSSNARLRLSPPHSPMLVPVYWRWVILERQDNEKPTLGLPPRIIREPENLPPNITGLRHCTLWAFIAVCLSRCFSFPSVTSQHHQMTVLNDTETHALFRNKNVLAHQTARLLTPSCCPGII
jgi:hypothetical protein